MAFDFKAAFQDALDAGLAAAKPGGKAAEDWVKQSAKANEDTLKAIAAARLSGSITPETAEFLLHESGEALKSEAAALAATLKAAAQAGVNAFLKSLSAALKAGIQLAL